MYNHLRDIPSAYDPFTKGDMSLKEHTLSSSFLQFSSLAFKLKISCTHSHFAFITLIIMTFLGLLTSHVDECIGEIVDFSCTRHVVREANHAQIARSRPLM